MYRCALPKILGLALALLFPLGAEALFAQTQAPGLSPPKGYVCYQAGRPLVIDGKLDDPAWADAPWTDDFVDIEGDDKPKPRFRTRAKMLWDDSFFYVAAVIEEPNVWGTLTRHDSVIFHDNDFEVFIDPDGDHHEYYEIEVNALNTGWDLFLKAPYRDGGPAVDAWEIPGLKTATHVDGTLNDPRDKDNGWTVELAFPWKVLAEFAHRPAPPRDGDQWRVNFSRVEWAVKVEGKTITKRPGVREDNWVWSPQAAVDMHRPEHWGFVQFSRKAAGQDVFRADPNWPVRSRLVEIYRAERAFFAKHKTWSTLLADLGLPADAPRNGAKVPAIRKNGEGFLATITLDAIDGRPARTFTIGNDSRLTVRED